MLISLFRQFPMTASSERYSVYILVFLALLVSGKLGYFLYFSLDVNPAFIWPPTGIALAAAFLLGYGVWPVLLLAFLVLTFMSGAGLPPIVYLMVSIAYTTQALLGGYILERFNFVGTMASTRDAMLLIFVAITTPLITPTVSVLTRMSTGVLMETPLALWISLSAGGIVSVLILTPLITSLVKSGVRPHAKHELTELLLVSTALLLVTYLLFWTAIPQSSVFAVLYLFFGVLFWIGLRIGARATVYAIVTVFVLGIVGIVFQHLDTDRLSAQLLATELFMILIAPIFYLMAALVEERKTVAEALNKRTVELEQSLAQLARDNDSKNAFIAILAHELRNPLAPLVTTLELVKLRTTDPELTELLTQAEQQTRTMRRLLDDLLDVVRITRNKFKLKTGRSKLQSILKHAVDSVLPSLEAAGHRLIIEQPGSDVWLEVDAVRLEQVLVNLLFNAVKYTQAPGTIRLAASLENGDVTLVVQDNGKGIPADKLQAIFRPFHQGGADSRAGTGLGIGLWLTKRLVGMHGGTVEATSEGLGLGSTFTVFLPKVVTVQAPLPEIPVMPAVPAAPERDCRILVVDDNEAAAVSMAKLLEHLGYATRMVHTGTEAIEQARTYRPHVVLLDIGLPDMDGYAVARALNDQKVNAKIIAVSGYGQSSDKERALQAGFHHHLTKPASVTDIEQVLLGVRANLQHV